jgi:hypothetical protein
MLPPWTPVETEQKPDGTREVRVWGRRHTFGELPFPLQIESGGDGLLTSPVTLTAHAGGEDVTWNGGRAELIQSSAKAAVLQQTCDGATVALRVDTSIEFDGYMIFECEMKARRDLCLDKLTLDIPLHTRFAELCYGDRVLPSNSEIPIAEWYSGEVRGDLAFRFSPTIWLGDETRGLCWQSETDRDWRNADRQKAIEILPRGDTTIFRARFIDSPTHLGAGKALRYTFALQATPVKPLRRDSWDLRIMRSEPYGRDLGLPARKINGQPAIPQLAKLGMRHLFSTVCDMWPYPMPVHENYCQLLRRLNDEMHAHGLKVYGYQIHERFPTAAPEFDIHGLHMAKRPLHQYIPSSNPPGSARPGPVGVEYGAGSQGTVFMCPKSQALQDAYVHSLAKRLDQYDDDGVYLDGTAQCPPCQNLGHGCGYRASDGSIHHTYPVFAVRQMMQRIYTVVKQRKPDGVVDVHCSWGYNPAGLAYADVMWTGEQWWHLRKTGAKHIPAQLPLDKFRTEFMGRQIGVAAETLSYRLGPRAKVAAISLLHDVPVRPNNAGLDQIKPQSPDQRNYSHVMIELWRLRDRFGAKEAEKLFYWENEPYVRLSARECYATLLRHPKSGVLAFVSNLRRDAQTVTVEFNLGRLGLHGQDLEALDALNHEPVSMSRDGSISVPLRSMEWVYVWLRPKASGSGLRGGAP